MITNQSQNESLLKYFSKSYLGLARMYTNNGGTIYVKYERMLLKYVNEISSNK